MMRTINSLSFCLMIALVLLFVVTACGPGDVYDLTDAENNYETRPEVADILEPPRHVVDITESIEIQWGFNPFLSGNDNLAHLDNLTGTHIQDFLNALFNVELVGVYIPSEDYWLEAVGADIFLSRYKEERYSTEHTRSIPELMIRTYAPRYAQLLDRLDGWSVSLSSDGNQMALNTFNGHHNNLRMVSVYRLDWLEELGFHMPASTPSRPNWYRRRRIYGFRNDSRI